MRGLGSFLLVAGLSASIISALFLADGVVECCENVASLTPLVGVLCAALGIVCIIRAA